MTHSRRSILKAAILAGPALFIPASLLDAREQTRERAGALGADGQPMRAPGAPITRSFLGGAVGSDFVARTPGGFEVPLRLEAVEDLPQAAVAGLEGSEQSFTARFESTSGALLEQGTYTLNHDWLGQLSIFLVPVGRPIAKSQTYEAVFNNAPTGLLKRVMPGVQTNAAPRATPGSAPRKRGTPPSDDGAPRRRRARPDGESSN